MVTREEQKWWKVSVVSPMAQAGGNRSGFIGKDMDKLEEIVEDFRLVSPPLCIICLWNYEHRISTMRPTMKVAPRDQAGYN